MKMTKREALTKLMDMEEVQGYEEIIAFLQHEIELLDARKSKSTKSKKALAEQESTMATLLDGLKTIGSPVTITEFQKQDSFAGSLSNQKVSAMLKKLVESGLVIKSTDKKVSHFFAESTED